MVLRIERSEMIRGYRQNRFAQAHYAVKDENGRTLFTNSSLAELRRVMARKYAVRVTDVFVSLEDGTVTVSNVKGERNTDGNE